MHSNTHDHTTLAITLLPLLPLLPNKPPLDFIIYYGFPLLTHKPAHVEQVVRRGEGHGVGFVRFEQVVEIREGVVFAKRAFALGTRRGEVI